MVSRTDTLCNVKLTPDVVLVGKIYKFYARISYINDYKVEFYSYIWFVVCYVDSFNIKTCLFYISDDISFELVRMFFQYNNRCNYLLTIHYDVDSCFIRCSRVTDVNMLAIWNSVIRNSKIWSWWVYFFIFTYLNNIYG